MIVLVRCVKRVVREQASAMCHLTFVHEKALKLFIHNDVG